MGKKELKRCIVDVIGRIISVPMIDLTSEFYELRDRLNSLDDRTDDPAAMVSELEKIAAKKSDLIYRANDAEDEVMNSTYPLILEIFSDNIADKIGMEYDKYARECTAAKDDVERIMKLKCNKSE